MLRSGPAQGCLGCSVAVWPAVACTVSGFAQSPCTALWQQPETGTAAPAAATAWPPAWHRGDLAGGAEGAVAAWAPAGGTSPATGALQQTQALSPSVGVRSSSSAASGLRCCSPAPRGTADRTSFIQGRVLPPHPPSKLLSPLFPFVSALFIPPPCAALAGAGVPGEGVLAPRVGWAVLQRGLEADVPDKDAALPLSLFFFF